MLRRLGRKSGVTRDNILKLVTPHKVWVEPFFGAGGMFFHKKRSDHNFLNDLDDEVYNFWTVFFNEKEKFSESVDQLITSQSLFKYWKKNKETDPIKKALRFLYLSNFSFFGKNSTFKLSLTYELKQIQLFLLKQIQHEHISNLDFRKFFHSCEFDKLNPDRVSFNIYCYNDPPYLGTGSNYDKSLKWTEKDLRDLIEINFKMKEKYKKWNFGISEFLTKDTERIFTEYGLYINEIYNRATFSEDNQRRLEILAINYKVEQESNYLF